MLSGQALKAIFKMNKYLYKFTDLSPKHTLELFDKLILPILSYSSEIWGFNKGTQVERIHLGFCKRLLGVKVKTQNAFIYGDTGRLNLQTRRNINIIKYWLKICNTHESKYIKKVYICLKTYSDLNPSKTNWVSQVKNLLSRLGYFDVWLSQGVVDEKIFILHLKQRIKDVYAQELSTVLNESSRAIFYKNIFDFRFSEYLNILTIRKYRIALSKLRLSSHRLAVETGRWRKPESVPYVNRKCLSCNVLDDEYHFVLKCKDFFELRKLHIRKYFWRQPSFFKFLQLLKSENNNDVRNLAIYIYKAFDIRNNIISV